MRSQLSALEAAIDHFQANGYHKNMGLLLGWLINIIAVVVGSYVIPGVTVDSWVTVAIVAAVIGIINAIIRPILAIITLPLTILTLGLFLLVINGMMILLADTIVPGFEVSSLWSGILFSLILAFIGWLAGKFK